MGALVDTSVLVAAVKDEVHSAWSQAKLAEHPDFMVSPMVLSELRFGVIAARNNSAIEMRRQATVTFAERFPCVAITSETAAIHARVMAELRALGLVRVRTHDLWIAASALEHGLTLITCNRRDFADIRGLKFTAPE